MTQQVCHQQQQQYGWSGNEGYLGLLDDDLFAIHQVEMPSNHSFQLFQFV